MEFFQKRLATNIKFEFGAADLHFWIRDNSGERDAVIDYSDIPVARRRVFDRNTWLRNVALLWCLLGVVQIAIALFAARPITGAAFWLVLGLVCLAAYRLSHSSYTVIDTDKGSIWILENKQSDQILEQLTERRKFRLKELYGSINPNNDPEREIQKFEWLVSEQALTRVDADRLISEVRGSAGMIAPPSHLLN